MSRPLTIASHFSRTFLLTVLLPLLLTGIGIAAWSGWQQQHRARDTLAATGRELAARVGDHLNEYRRGMTLLSEILAMEAPERFATGRSSWLDLFSEIYTDYVSMLIAAPDGDVIAAAPWNALSDSVQAGLNVADRDYFRAARQDGDVFFSNVFRGRGFGEDPIVAVSVGFAWPGPGGGRGVVEGSLDLTRIERLIGHGTDRDLIIQLVDRERRLIASSAADQVPLTQLEQDEAPRSTLARLWSSAWFTVREPIPGLGWEVVVRQPVAAVYAPLWPFLSGLVLVVLSAFVVAGVVFTRASRRIAGWVREAADRVDVPHPEKIAVPPPGARAPSEIQALAKALESLIATVRKQRDELRRHLAELEVTVEARTFELREQRREFREFLAQAPALIVSVDQQGRILYSNNFWNEVVGCGADDPDCPTIDSFLDESARAAWDEATGQIVDSGDSVPVRLTLQAGEDRLEVSGRLIRQETAEAKIAIRGVFQDISELVRTQRKLSHSEQMLSLFVKNAPAGIAMFDCDMNYISASERWLEDYQLVGKEVIGRSYYEVFPETPDRWKEIHATCLRTGEPMRKAEDLLERSDGTSDWVRWEIIPWREVDGELGGLIMLTEVITEKKLLEDQLRVLADYDSLTGLLNRRAFLDRLRRVAKRRDPKAPTYGLLFIDLDRFKAINDAHGHYVGDRVLQEVGRRLKSLSRAEDVAGRLAGDEFVVLLTDAEESGLPAIIARYEELISQPLEAAGYRFSIQASIGGVLAEPGEAADDLLDRADRAMYRVKREEAGEPAENPDR